MSKKIYSPEELKVINKKVRGLAKIAHLHSEFYHVPDKTITKSTIQKILEFRNEPFYDAYLDFAIPEIEKLKTIPSDQKPVFEKVKPLIEECINEERLGYDIKHEIWKMDREELVKKLAEFKVNDQFELENQMVKQKLGNQSPCNRLEKEIEPFDKLITKSILNEYYHKQFLSVITPDLTPEDIKTKRPNFDRGLELFIQNFKEESKESQKDDEWNKQFLSRDISKKYFKMLANLVNTDEVKSRVEQAFIQSIQNETQHAISDYDRVITRKNDIEIELQKLRVDRADIYQIEKYKKFLSGWKELISRYDTIIKNNWDKSTQSFTKNVEIEAKQETENTIVNFVQKNTEKMALVLSKREDCDTFEPKLNYDNIMIEGNINVKCKNGDEFRVNNQLVFVPEGEKRAHYRFPTTFHDVKMKGKTVKMFSEQEMNQFFTKME